MQHQDWLDRWTAGNTGWHQTGVNESLREFWVSPGPGARVLVPLCGKSWDLLWLAEQDLAVTGVELSAFAIEGFFSEHNLAYEKAETGSLICYRAVERDITLHCGDYFNFTAPKFDALFDRASLIALDAEHRPAYAAHTKALLNDDAFQLLITLEYDQTLVHGPPFCVMAEEVHGIWPELRRVHEKEALDSCPPKFRGAGVSHVNEVTWVSNAG